MRKVLTLMFAALLCAACNRNETDEILLQNTDISLSLKGKLQYTFNPNKGQAAYNDDRTSYRYTDDDLSSWFVLECQSRPANTGDHVTADLKWASKTSFGDEQGLEFIIKQTDENGMIWMWNDTKNIGLIIRDFE